MGFGAVNIDTAGIGGLISGIGDTAKKLREAITGKTIVDPAKMAEIEKDLAQIEASSLNAQLAVNQAEAASGKMFLAGWRPFCGWVCVCGLIWAVFIVPIWAWASANFLQLTVPPAIDTGILVTILLGMLGLGGLRTYEKKQDLQDKH